MSFLVNKYESLNEKVNGDPAVCIMKDSPNCRGQNQSKHDVPTASITMLQVKNPILKIGNLKTPFRLLCGPGPSNSHPRVNAALSLPQTGYLDPDLLSIVEDLKALLRYVWQTSNHFTFPVSGAGSAAWEAAVANLTNQGDVHLVFVCGYFGERHCDIASRYGAKIIRIDKPWGEAFSVDEIIDAINQSQPDVVWLCLVETSTGVLQSLEGVGKACRSLKKDCLLMVDTVTAIGGVECRIDDWEIDVSYACAQKCIGAPPCISPITFSDRAMKRMLLYQKTRSVCRNWYLDMNLLSKYLFAEEGKASCYHHTICSSLIYALREALTLIAEEGLENSWKRHKETAKYFSRLVESELGLEFLVASESQRSPSLHTLKVPAGVDAAAVIKYCRERFMIEIGGGLSSLAGKIFRVGLMGFNSRDDAALQVVSALKESLLVHGWTKKK